MGKKKLPVAYEKRYRHKLNMLEPGTVMLKVTGSLLLAGGVCFLLHWKIPAYILWGLACAVFLVLLILLAIEAHQDRVLNEIAAGELERQQRNGYPM